MKNKIVFTLLTAFSMMLAFGFEINSNWVIATPEKPRPAEKRAAIEIATYIEAVSGLRLKTVTKVPEGVQAVNVKTDGKYDSEEWNVSRTKNGLDVSGGYPNGILYAAYEFIEKGLGCRFLTYDCEYIPKLKKIVLPDDFKLAGKPFFAGRQIYTAEQMEMHEFRKFNVKRKQNSRYISPEYGWYDRSVHNYTGHTYYIYAATFPKDKDEYFSLSKDGKRLRPVNGVGPGQICLSNKDVRELVVKKMSQIIEKDRASMEKNYKGMPPSYIIDLSHNDNNDKCVCPGCLALEKKYVKYSGAVLDFTNDIAERIEKLYPGTVVQTFAYSFSEEAPEGIKPRKNVLVQLAQLGAEFAESGSARDSLRPLDHPNNKKALKLLKDWSAFGASLKMWDYWVLYTQRFAFPCTNISAIAPNLRTYAENNVTRIFGENEFVTNGGCYAGNFRALGFYLGSHLMVDPKLDPKVIIDEFMRLYYGPSAEKMTELLKHIESSMEREPRNIGIVGITSKYLDKEFFEKGEKLFAEAEKAAGNDKKILERIGEERIEFDTAAINLQRRLGLKIDRDKVIERLHKNYEHAVKNNTPAAKWAKYKESIDNRFERMKKQLPLPKQFENKEAYDFPWFALSKPYTCEWIDDSEAAGGKAIKLTGKHKAQPVVLKGFHKKELSFGLYDPENKIFRLTKEVPRAKMPTDEKYHWYHIGRSKLSLKNTLWVHWAWWLTLNCANSVYDSLTPNREYDIWVSIKLEGPSYSPGSQKEDAVLVDRVIFTKP